MVAVEDDAAAGAEKVVYSAVALRFGWTGGERSVVGRKGDGECDRERERERCRSAGGYAQTRITLLMGAQTQIDQL